MPCETAEPIGRRALVTGGNRGIGLAVVRRLAESGAEVTFTARSQDSLEVGLKELAGSGSVEGHVCDVTDPEGMATLMTLGFHILVNNAGVIGPIGRMTEVDLDDWARNIEINLIAPFHVLQLALPAMIERGGGTIVNLSSGAAHRYREGWSAYCASKAGLAMLTKAVHEEWGSHGVRVFGLAPGMVDTGMQGEIRASGINPVSQMPRDKLSPPDLPACAVAWLCTPEADSLAGQELDIRHETFLRVAGLEIPA